MSRIFIKTKNIIWEHLYIVLKILLACTLTQSPWSTCSIPLFYPPHLLSSPGRYPISLSPILVSTVGAAYLPSWSRPRRQKAEKASFLNHCKKTSVKLQKPGLLVQFISRPSQGALKKKWLSKKELMIFI